MTQGIGEGSRQSFVGFQQGSHLYDVVSKQHNGALREFTTTLFKQISETNKGGRQVNQVAEDRRFLDAVAQIITGNEVCGAIAISGKDILIATNKGDQDKKSVLWHVKATILELSSTFQVVRLSLTCYIESIDGKKIEKKSDPLEYRFDGSTRKAVLVGNQNVEFKFLESEFAYLPDDSITVTYRLHAELDEEMFSGFFRCCQVGQQIDFHEPIVTSTGALKRRTAKVIHLLSFIAHIVFSKREYVPENAAVRYQDYIKYVNKKYKQYKKDPQNDSPDGFIESIRQDCKVTFHLDQPGRDTTEIFLEGAREQYEACDNCDKASNLLKNHGRWVSILNDSLTYELSRFDDFKNHINVSPKAPKGLDEMHKLYEGLLGEYKSYKDLHHLETSLQSVKDWCQQLSPKPSYPQYIRDHFKTFCKTAFRLFESLAIMEVYIKKDAEQNGLLAQRIKNENIFKDLEVIIVDGEKDVHAEMRLFSHHLLSKNQPSNYYGIGKLCCALCNYTFKQFQASGTRVPDTRGTFATLFRWPLPEALREKEYMKTFLGGDLFHQYASFGQMRLLTPDKGKSFEGKEVCWGIISGLENINNSVEYLTHLGLKDWEIKPSRDHYAQSQ